MSIKNRGFGSMSQNKKEEIARKGGEARKKSIGKEGYSNMGKKGSKSKKATKNDKQ